jgi:hypothetical protein
LIFKSSLIQSIYFFFTLPFIFSTTSHIN